MKTGPHPASRVPRGVSGRPERRAALFLVFLLLVLLPAVCLAQASGSGPEQPAVPAEPPAEPKWIDLEFEPDAYYTFLGLTVALTKTPIPRIGERSEKEIYTELLSRAFSPRFLYLEASFNPMPYVGTYVKDQNRNFYDDAEVTGSFNWIKAVTAGFEEPWAGSVFLGTVVDFDTPGSKDTKGIGWSGFLFSTGNYHIKDNELVKDTWREFEWKIKGDRKSPVKKLNWSYRIGAKIHDYPYITDIVYLAMRRSRVDYKPENASLFNNSGYEYRVDMDRRTLRFIRHYFYVDKKWPLENKRMAFAFAVGFVWESAQKYTGPLAVGREGNDFQIILRPNIEF